MYQGLHNVAAQGWQDSWRLVLQAHSVPSSVTSEESVDKCAWLESRLGVDAALNYKRSTFKEDFKNVAGCPDVHVRGENFWI